MLNIDQAFLSAFAALITSVASLIRALRMCVRREKWQMSLTHEQELWGVALWVEKHHGANGWLHIALQQDRLLAQGDFEGMKLWRQIGERFEKLQAGEGSPVSG